MNTHGIAQVAVLVPARRMESSLAPLVRGLSEAGFGAIIVVNDGMSTSDCQEFDKLAAISRVHPLNHAVNLGKGRALKTGINYSLSALPGFLGLVTADADGQHAIEDIICVAEALILNRDAAILGCRRFTGAVPLRSRFGNAITRAIFFYLSGRKVSDTQTGLRAFPFSFLPELLALPGERYEYEMTVLAHLSSAGKKLIEIPIETIYLEGNASSNFNPLRDSMRIYFVLIRFYASSRISAGLDLTFFTFVFWMTHNVLLAVIVGRVSSLINFALNRSLVFHSRTRLHTALWRYYLLALVLAAISYGSILELSTWLGWNVVAIKILIETALSLLSFSVQKTFVFSEDQRA